MITTYFVSINQELYLQLVRKSTLTQSDEKQCYKNFIESTPWERN